MIEYDFTKGLYRVKVKTTYRRADMSMNDSAFSDAFIFRCTVDPTYIGEPFSGEVFTLNRRGSVTIGEPFSDEVFTLSHEGSVTIGEPFSGGVEIE